MMGSPFSGIGLNGYDNNTGKYVSTWMDTMSTAILYFEGTAGADGKTITQTARYDDVVQGPMQFRSVTRMVDDNTMVFRIVQHRQERQRGEDDGDDLYPEMKKQKKKQKGRTASAPPSSHQARFRRDGGTGDEHRRIVQGAARPHARRHGRLCRARRSARSRHAGQPAGRGACRCDRHEGGRRQRPDAARHDLPHLLDDQADHGRGDDDPGGGMQAAAGRAGGSAAARAGRPQGAEAARRAARRHRAREPADHRARPADLPHGLRHDHGAAGHVSDPEGRERAAARAWGRRARRRRLRRTSGCAAWGRCR